MTRSYGTGLGAESVQAGGAVMTAREDAGLDLDALEAVAMVADAGQRSLLDDTWPGTVLALWVKEP